ncbi:MAG: VTT domain-containing protein [Gemmatimonadota bacterium]
MTDAALSLPADSGTTARRFAIMSRRRGTAVGDGVLRVCGLLALVSMPVVLLVPGAASFVVFLLVTVVVNGPLSPVLPATYEPLLIYFSLFLGPLTTALLGTAGVVFVEYLNYHLHQELLKTRTAQRVTGGRMVQRVVGLFSRRPAFTVWLCAWSPLPYWPVRLLSPMAGLPLSRHLMATALGRFPQYLAVIALGTQLHLSSKALIAIMVGSSLLALGVWLIRRVSRRPAVIAGAALLAGVLVTHQAMAQRDDMRIPDGPALGFTVDRFRLPEEADRFTTVTLHVTQLNAGGLSPNFAVGLFPTLFPAYEIVTSIDAGIGYNISLPRVTILPYLGASSLFEIGAYNSAGPIGLHVGVGVLINFSDNNAIRLDLTRREYFSQDRELRSSLSLGVGVSGVQPRNRRTED